MMKYFIFKCKGKYYLVDFYYYNDRVMCRIYEDYTFISEGLALFNSEDDPSTYSKYYGEKLALTRALRYFMKDFRKVAWYAYKRA